MSAQTYQVGAHFEALIQGILMAALKTIERFFSISSSPAGLRLINDTLIVIHLILLYFRLLLGLTKKWRKIEFRVMGTCWSNEKAMVHKCDESYLEAGVQLILQTFILMTKQWRIYTALLSKQQKGYYLQGDARFKEGNGIIGVYSWRNSSNWFWVDVDIMTDSKLLTGKI